MTQSLIDQKSNVQVVLISIKAVATGESKAMLVRFFHGVYLPTGVSIKVDGGPSTPLAFQKSDRLGVYAALPLTDKIVAEMKRGKGLRLSVQINQGEPLEVVARLNGFGPAFDRINSMH
jgi:invasion protein IalB